MRDRHLPIREITGPKLALGYIRFFEPDVFVETHDGLAAEVGLGDDLLELGEPRIIPISTFSDLNPDRTPRPFGTSIVHVYRRLYEREFRFVSRDGERVAAVSTAGIDGGFIEAVFGGFPADGGLASMQTAYGDAFKPAETPKRKPCTPGFWMVPRARQPGCATSMANPCRCCGHCALTQSGMTR